VCFTSYSQENSNNLEEIEKREMRASYMNYLTSEGYSPSIDDDLDIKFKFEGNTYYIFVKSKMSFILVRVLSNSNGCNDVTYKTINKVNSRFRNISAYLSDSCNIVYYKSVSWLNNEDDYKGILEISLNIINNAVNSSQEYYSEFKNEDL
jgi:hypothetical protein